MNSGWSLAMWELSSSARASRDGADVDGVEVEVEEAMYVGAEGGLLLRLRVVAATSDDDVSGTKANTADRPARLSNCTKHKMHAAVIGFVLLWHAFIFNVFEW